MSEQKYTPEPWAAYQDGKIEFGNINHFIKSLAGDLISYGHLSKDDARRIVACVNACAGIDTSHLEKYGLPDFAQKISDLREQRDSFKDAAEYNKRRAEDAEKQRDELLADLRGIAAIAHCGGLVQMSESDALTAIRRATLPHFSTDATEEQHRAAIASMKDHFRDATKMINPESDMIERECCGTFFRTPHRSTCKKYRGKKGGA